MSGKTPNRGSPDRLEARCRVLEEAVRELERDNRELRAQFDGLADRRHLASDGVEPRAQATRPLPPPPLNGPKARLKGVVRRLLQATVGTARRMWQAGDPGQRFVVSARSSGRAADGLPRISIVVVSDHLDVPGERPGFGSGSLPEWVEVAWWNPVSGELAVWAPGGPECSRRSAGSRDEVLAGLEGDWLVAVPDVEVWLTGALLEDLQSLVAVEPLSYVRVPCRSLDTRYCDAGDGELVLCSREVFDPESRIDVDRLARSARSHPVLGKRVRLGGPLDAASPRPVTFCGAGRGLVVAVGRYELWTDNRAGPVDQPVAVVPSGEATIVTEDDRTSVAVVACTALDGGVDRLLADLFRELGGEARFRLVTTSTDHALTLDRAAMFETAEVPVHELGSVLDPSTWPSSVVGIVERCGASVVAFLGWEERLAAAALELAERGVEIVALAADDGAARVPAQRWLVETGAGAASLARAGVPEDRVEVAPLGLGDTASLRPGSYGGLQAVRSELGVPEGGRLVLSILDLVPRCRPEDVMLAADLLRDREELFFAVIGDGPLAGRLLDLAAYSGVTAFTLRPPFRSIPNLLAAADVVLDTAVEAPARPVVAAALAMGRPVVAAAGVGIAELGAGWMVDPLGGPEALAEAVRRVLEGDTRVGDPEAIQKTIGRRAAAGREVVRQALLGDVPRDGDPR